MPRRAASPPSPASPFLSQFPTFKEFIHNEWRDLLVMFLCMVVALPLNASPPIAKRRFPITGNPADVADYAYPERDQIILVPVSAVLAIFPNLLIFSLAQIRLRSYPDLHASWYGLLSTLTMSTFIQCILKSFVGGLRPYFYDACKPSPDAVPGTGTGYGGIIFDSSVCTGDKHEIVKALTSFPSGHSNAAMASGLFLSLWLNGKLKIFADARARFWKLLVFFFPILFAWTLMGSLTLDQSHNWYDVIAGGSIGIICALAGYRTRYAAVWDFRFNHIPLPRASYLEKVPLSDNLDDIERASSDTNEKTRKKGLFTRSPRKFKYIKRSQRFTYDLSSLAHSQHHDLPQYASDPSQPSTTERERIRWNLPGRQSAPQDPRFPVLTRRWQGSVVGSPGDAGWTHHTHDGGARLEGLLGLAHGPQEYGRPNETAAARGPSAPEPAVVRETNGHVAGPTTTSTVRGEGSS